MTLSIYRNLMAENTANNLNGHYARLATSTERLSSGLRINSAADDAAGLAIRELMRADIAALNQGARNINDAISMIQTFDGALGVIDEKLIRMKELAEQAATGTYDSTQRLMIDSEFQAMGSEINRIARATDFNGIKLLDGNWEGAEGAGIAGHAAGAGAPELELGRVTATGFDVASVRAAIAGLDLDALGAGTFTFSFRNQDWYTVPNNAGVEMHVKNMRAANGTNFNITAGAPAQATGRGTWNVTGTGVTAANVQVSDAWPGTAGSQPIDIVIYGAGTGTQTAYSSAFTTTVRAYDDAHRFTSTASAGSTVNAATVNGNALDVAIDLGNGQNINAGLNFTAQAPVPNRNGAAARTGADMTRTASFSFTVRQKAQPQEPTPGEVPSDKVKIHFGTMNDSAEDYYYVGKHDATLKGLGLDGVNIQTQQNAQEALVQIGDAIVAKDKIRAEYGAMQNRFENTLTNITGQAEHLRASESRISDADIAQEMTAFVRSQVLTNSAVAMLAQANNIPQMVYRLIQ